MLCMALCCDVSFGQAVEVSLVKVRPGKELLCGVRLSRPRIGVERSGMVM